MKIYFLAIAGLFFFSSSKCKKEGENCHRKITIINNSTNSIIRAFKYYSDNKCQLNGSVIASGDLYEDKRNGCFEGIVTDTQLYDLYIVDPNNYNAPLEFYDCDSIEIKNTVLKHYVLTLDELKAMNFTISYP